MITAVLDAVRPGDLSEVLIVGDSLTSDSRGGMNAGIRTCWYDPGKHTVPEGYRVDWQIADLHEVVALLEKENA